MDTPSLLLVLCYAAALVLLSRGSREGSLSEYLLAGRRLSLPAFVATLVTTWYGGILGIGEYSWRFGISTWLVFGVPYYLAAVLFALFLAGRLRRSEAFTLPDLLAAAYGPRTATGGALGIFALTLPVAYLLMLATLISELCGCSLFAGAVVGAAFSAFYVGLSGFRAVVRTDLLQLVLMYGGFLILLPMAMHHVGGFGALWQQLPASHRAWDGGLGWQAVAVWYLIALQTMVEPSFYQRAFAARTTAVARRGVLISVALWMVFDFCTTFSGLAARVLLPGLEDPVRAFPALAELVLPSWLLPLFVLALFATVMSTLDSYLFLAASTVGHDLAPRRGLDERRRTRWGLALCAALTVAGTTIFDSPVQVWHHVGSVVTSALLLPVLAVHLPPRWRYSSTSALLAMAAAALTAALWISRATDAGYPLGLEPMFPALAVSTLVWLGELLWRSRPLR